MQVERCGYFIPVNQVKSNGEKLSQEDLINIGAYVKGSNEDIDLAIEKNKEIC